MFSFGSLWELRKPERSSSISPSIYPFSIHLSVQHPLSHPFNSHPFTSTQPPIQHPPSHPFNIFLSTHSTSIPLPIQHPSIHPFNIHPATHSTSICLSIHPLVDASNISQKPIYPSDPYVFTHHPHTSSISPSHSSVQNPSQPTPIYLSTHEDIQWASSIPDLREASVALGNSGIVRP